jgi:Predicted membrane protein (DUF2079)
MTAVAGDGVVAHGTRWFARASTWTLVVWIATGAYAIGLGAESLYQHDRFTTGFDTAVFDQGLWLLSQGDEPFSTVVDRSLVAGLQPGIALLTPLYWAGGGVEALLVVQALGLALAAPALYALARDRGAQPALAAVPALLWLVSPWTASVNLVDFHPQVFAPALLALSALAGLRGQWLLLGLSAALAMSLKQDIPLAYLMLGVVLAFSGRRRAGAILAAAAVAWQVAAGLTFESDDNSYAFFEKRFAGDRGDNVGEAISWMARHPLETLGDVLGQSGGDLFLLALATAALAFLAPLWLLLALPSLLYNALSAYPAQHSLAFQYHLMTGTGLFIAAAVGVRRVETFTRPGRLALAGALTAACAAAFLGGVQVHGRWERDPFDGRDRAQIRAALARVPADVPVAASTHLQPHLSRREKLFTLPEPFVPIDWGGSLTPAELRAEVPTVRYVALAEGDGPIEYPRDIATVIPLVRRAGFVEIYRGGRVRLFERRP